MALSILMRSAFHGCKLRPSFGSAFKISKVSFVSCQRLDSLRDQRDKCLPIKSLTAPAPKLSEIVRKFSVTPVVQSAGHHDHSKMWTIERYVSVALLVTCPLGIMYPNVLFDIIMAVAVVMHMHWGFEAVVMDYVRPVIFGQMIPKIGIGLVYLISILTLVGLFNLTFNNCGIGNSIRLLWDM